MISNTTGPFTESDRGGPKISLDFVGHKIKVTRSNDRRL